VRQGGRVLLLTLAFLAAPSARASINPTDLQIPPPAPLVDEFNLIGAGDSARIEQVLRAAKENGGVEISVLIARDLRGLAIEDLSIAVVEKWGLGRRKDDKGLLLLVAPKERQMRFEVGYGLEGQLTDAASRRILDNVMRPYFRQGRYADGIIASLYAVQERVPLGLDLARAPVRRSGKGSVPDTIFFIAIVLLFIFLTVLRLLGGVPVSGYRRGGGWGGSSWGGGGGSSWGGGGGSSWGGGGGGFGGGGASSSW